MVPLPPDELPERLPWLTILMQASAMLEARMAHYPELDDAADRALMADCRYIARTLMEQRTKAELLDLAVQHPALLLVDLRRATSGTIRFEQTPEGALRKALYLALRGVLVRKIEQHYNRVDTTQGG